MTTQKFEVYGSVRPELNGTESFLLNHKSIAINYKQLFEAICLYRHKEGLSEDKYLGYKITDKEIVLYFER